MHILKVKTNMNLNLGGTVQAQGFPEKQQLRQVLCFGASRRGGSGKKSSDIGRV